MPDNNVIWDPGFEDWGYQKPFNETVKCIKCGKCFDVELHSYYSDSCVAIGGMWYKLLICPYCDCLYLKGKTKPLKLKGEFKWYERIIRKILWMLNKVL